MKKITYLVAPLMVLPFLVGCNKAETYKVSVGEGEHLTFKSEDGKELSQVRAEKGKSFKFKVEAEKVEETQYTVMKDYVIIAVGDNVLYDGYQVYWDGENEADRSKATVIIDAEKVTGDILVGGIAGIKDHYYFDAPLLYGLECKPSGEAVDNDHPNYMFNNKKLTVTFTVKDVTATTMGAWVDIDGYGYDTIDEYAAYTGVTLSGLILTIDPTSERVVPQDSFSIVARANDKDDQWLNSFDWNEIKYISDNGLATKFFMEGDTKTFKFNETDTQVYSVRIIGFNHDTLAADKTRTAGITFEFANLLTDENGGAITKAWGEAGKKCHQNFIASDYNKYLNDETEGAESVINKLPNELKKVISPVVKKVGVYNDGWKATEYEPKLFPLAYTEITSTGSQYDVGQEGTIYSYFKTHSKSADRKLTPVGTSTAAAYWLRSPSTHTEWPSGDTYNRAFEVTATGSVVEQTTASTAKGVAPCFCI